PSRWASARAALLLPAPAGPSMVMIMLLIMAAGREKGERGLHCGQGGGRRLQRGIVEQQQCGKSSESRRGLQASPPGAGWRLRGECRRRYHAAKTSPREGKL